MNDQELYQQQKGKCAISGVDIVLVNKIKNNNVDWSVVTASLDRIDSSIGYIETNVQPVCNICNKMKLTQTEEEFKNKLLAIIHNKGWI